MSTYNPTKYPEIIIDSQTNYQNATGTVHRLTVEEFKDIMHHTHKIGDHIGGNDVEISAGEVTKEEFEDLQQSVNQLQTLVQALQNSIIPPSEQSQSTNERLYTIENAMSQLSIRMTEIEASLGIENMSNTYNERITALENVIGNTESSETGVNLTIIQRIERLENDNANGGLILDYDLDTPGVQDISGNTIN